MLECLCNPYSNLIIIEFVLSKIKAMVIKRKSLEHIECTPGVLRDLVLYHDSKWLQSMRSLICQAEDRADDEGFPQCGLLGLGAGPQNLAEVVDGLDPGKDHHDLDFRYMLVHM